MTAKKQITNDGLDEGPPAWLQRISRHPDGFPITDFVRNALANFQKVSHVPAVIRYQALSGTLWPIPKRIPMFRQLSDIRAETGSKISPAATPRDKKTVR